MHTPGPWNTGIKHPCRVIAHNSNHVVALTCREEDDNGGDHSERDADNARLIAATPDLLEACKLALKEVKQMHDHFYPSCCCYVGNCPAQEVIVCLTAAIAKTEKGNTL